MKNRRLFNLLSITVILVFIISLFSTVNVLADDSTPPAPTGEPVEPPADEPVDDGSSTESTPEVDIPAEILDSAPEGVDVVVLDENGDPLPLTTQEAADIILAGDPMWCLDDLDGTPQDNPVANTNGCTNSYGDFATLLADLASGAYDLILGDGNGTIFVESSYALSEGEIQIDHNNGSLGSLNNLTIQGGWVPGTGVDTSTQSTLNGTWLSIFNWVGAVTVNNLFIDNANGTGLYIETNDNVYVNDVTVEDSTGLGIYINSYGEEVNVEDVTVQRNGLDAQIDDYGDAAFADGANGMDIYASGDVTLTDVYAYSNGNHGVYVDSDGFVNIFDSSFEGNGYTGSLYLSLYGEIDETSYTGFILEYAAGSGLFVDADGNIYLENVESIENAGDGIILYSDDGSIDIYYGSFNGNGWGGALYEDDDAMDLFEDYMFTFCSSIDDLDGTTDGDTYGSALFNPCTDSGYIDVSGPYLDYDVYAELGPDGYYNYYTIDQDGGHGLDLVTESGSITLTDIQVLNNGGTGAYVYGQTGVEIAGVDTGADFGENGGRGYLDVGECFGVGEQECLYEIEANYVFDSYLEFEYGNGLFAASPSGEVTLTGVEAYLNYNNGAEIRNYYNDSGSVFIYDSCFCANGAPILIGGEGGLFGPFLDEELGIDDDLLIPASELALNVSFYGDSSPFENASIYAELTSGSGLVVESSSNITIEGIGAGGNFGDGAYLSADGVINITDADFDENGGGMNGYFYGESTTESSEFESYIQAGNGLSAYSNGNITLNNVYAEDNALNGAELSSWDGSVSIENGEFSGNGSFGGFYNGNSYDEYYDEDLAAYVPVEEEYSGSWYGSGLDIYAAGNITLATVTANTNSSYGAMLDGNAIQIEESEFSENGDDGGYESYFYDEGDDNIGDEYVDYDYYWYGSGLGMDANNKIVLIDVTANGNYVHGAEAYSNGGRVIVSCGQYNENGEYGIDEYGAASLELYGPEIAGNGYSPDEYYFSGSLIISEDCTIPADPTSNSQKSEGGALVCEGFATNATFNLLNGDFAVFPCPINDSAFIQSMTTDELPGGLADGQKFLSGLKTQLTRDGTSQNENDRAMQISFLIPKDVDVETLAILYWNGTEWVDLGGEVSEDGLYFEVSTNFVGTFVLVSN